MEVPAAPAAATDGPAPASDQQVDGDEASTHADVAEGADDGEGGQELHEPAPGSRRAAQVKELEEEGDIAADFLEGLLDIADLDGDIDMDIEGERAAVSIVGGDLGQLVGPEGKVLEALQELTRLAVYRETGERSRLMLDIAGHRAARKRELIELTRTTVESVRSSGEKVTLEAMTPFERKVVHDAVADAGLSSSSIGEEPQRRVVIAPGS
ncbi:MAG: protein jag [Nocardioidaceae bacterium]